MLPHPAAITPHLLLLTGMGCMAMFINASTADQPLRALDRDLFAMLRFDHADLLRSLDLRAPAWMGGATFSAMDLSGQDLRELRMADSSLRDLSLKGSHLEQATFECVTMQNVELAGANLREAQLDYADCGNSSSDQNVTLSVNLNGADFTQAKIRGGAIRRGAIGADGKATPAKCTSWLTIRGNLNGARFSGATLQCVALLNTSEPTNAVPSAPVYAGIDFAKSTINHLYLASGDFGFSDFYEARMKLLTFAPHSVNLRFTNMASMQCSDQDAGCQLMQADGSGTAAHGQPNQSERLTLNVRNSRIASNLALPSEPSWPSLLCSAGSHWTIVDGRPDLPSGRQATGSLWTATSPGQAGSATPAEAGVLIRAGAATTATCAALPAPGASGQGAAVEGLRPGGPS